MSLDVYLKTDKPVKKSGTGVFVRDGGKTKELSVDEVKERWPDSDPKLEEYETNEVWHGNVTHNLGEMARMADAYMVIWRPDELKYKYARELVPYLEIAVERLTNNREFYEQFNPENGWGNYETFVAFVLEYLNACREHPDTLIKVSR